MIKNKRSAFTLAEMMVVMLILTILLAAFAPLMTKKSKVDLSNPWRWAANNSDIYYGIGGNQTALIGQNAKTNTDPNAKLLINQSNNNNPYISFKNSNNDAGGIFINPTRGSIGMRANIGVKDDDLIGNTGFGIDSMINGDSSVGSTAFGSGAMRYNYAARNTAIGLQTIMGKEDSSSIPAGDNTAVGYKALRSVSTLEIPGNAGHYLGIGNTAVGSEALTSETSGTYNTAVGISALKNSNQSYYNTAVGAGALGNNTGGMHNVALGFRACQNVTSGSSNICIGADAGPGADASNGIWIGSASQTLHILGNFTLASDRRLKNIKSEFKPGLDVIRGLTTYSYTYKSDETNNERVGIMAQDLQKVLPSAVARDSEGYLEVKQERITFSMLNAIKQLDKMLQELVTQVKAVVSQVAEHDKQIKALQKENKELKTKVNNLEKRLNDLEKKLK